MPMFARLRHRVASVALAAACTLVPLASVVAKTATPAAAQTATALPPLPAPWPSTLQLGIFDGAGGAASMKADMDYGFRYAYLAGGVNTGGGWANWNPDGRFATYWIEDSVRHGIVPSFTYYMLSQSAPGSSGEGSANLTNLQHTGTMTAYYRDLTLLFQRAAEFPNQPVVVHVEPDLWGFLQQSASGDDAGSISAQVAATGLPELAGLPDTAAGFGRAIVALRDTYARNVVLAYHLSIWGTGNDIQYSNPSDAEVDALATRSGHFYRSLGANFDLAFGEFSDRDAAFKQHIYGDGGASWWDAGDFARHVRYLARFVNVTQKRVALWQIPFGNTKMRAMDNTWNHYQDNRVEWLLDDPSRAHLDAYVRAGVVALLFGRGAGGTTCPCDSAGDGVTNPEPINGNNGWSLNADDDGGFFRDKARAYYAAGAMSLPPGSTSGDLNDGNIPLPAATATTAPTAIATRTAVPTARPATATPTPLPAATATPQPTQTGTTQPTQTATPTTGAAPSFTSNGSVSPTTASPGDTVTVTVEVVSGGATQALIDLRIYRDSDWQQVFQTWHDDQTFNAGERRRFTASWTVPDGAASGGYTFMVGAFSVGWGGQIYSWNPQVAQFQVQA